MIGELLKQVAVAAGRAAAKHVAAFVVRKLEPESEDESHPLTYRHVEHNRRMEAQALEASRAAAAERKRAR